jgi:hypothetical protein
MTKNNKKQKTTKVARDRTREERQLEIRPIIEKLASLNLTVESSPIMELYTHIRTYINDGTRITINIPFENIGRTIRGVLATDVKEEVWVKLEKSRVERDSPILD